VRVILSYPTLQGLFELGQDKSKSYHILYDEESIGEYNSVQEAVDALINNQTKEIIHPETNEKIDASKLDIPRDYTQWDSGY
jgi:hypothetical protein